MTSLVHPSLRSFVALAEHGTLTAAGQAISRSPSAVSLQISGLEQRVGRQLFLRGAAGMRLAPAGRVLLEHARRLLQLEQAAGAAVRALGLSGEVRFGMPQDFAASRLSSTLSRFRRAHEGVKVTAVIERNSVIAGFVKRAELDVALLISRQAHRLAVDSSRRKTHWYASPALEWRRSSAPLPLVLLEEPCIYREDALRALDRAGIKSTVAFTTGSVAAMWAAVQAGVGVTARMDLGAPAGVQRADTQMPRLPALGATTLSLVRCRQGDGDAVSALANLVAAALRDT